MLILACAMAFFLSGCQEEPSAQPRPAFAAGRGHRLPLDEGLRPIRATCERTRGRWHQNLVRCDCNGPEEVFSVSQGCISLNELSDFKARSINPFTTEMQPLIESQDGLYTVSLRLRQLSDVSSLVGRKTAELLQGFTLPPPDRRVMYSAVFGRLAGADDVPRYVRNDDLSRAIVDSFVDIDFFAAAETDSGAAMSPSWRHAAAAVVGDSPPRSASYWEAGANCWPACGTVSEFLGAGSDIWRVNIDMVAFVPVQRQAVLTQCDGELTASLLPDGSINHTKEKEWSFIDDPMDQRLIQERITFADRRGKTLTIPEGWIEEEFYSATKQALADFESSFTHARRARGIGLAVVEDSIDLTDSVLASMADFRPPEQDIRSGSGITPKTECAVRNVLNVLGRISEHGTGVSKVLTRGLEQGRLSLLDASEVFWNRDVDLGTKWSQFINARDVRVVILSQMHGLVLPYATCKRFFSDLFGQSPNTLFVVGAGNSGWVNVNSCAQGLSRSFDNVVTVAGTRDNGRVLELLSNRGADTVDLAAPWASGALHKSGRSFAGTSHAAPWVGNLAAKYWTVLPNATVAEVKSALFDSCEMSRGLDVACGGSIHEATFMEMVAAKNVKG